MGILTGLEGLSSPITIVGGTPSEDLNVEQLLARLGDETDEEDIGTLYDLEVGDIYSELYADIERGEFALNRFSAEVAQVRVRFMYFVDVASLEDILAGISQRLGPVQTRAAEIGARVGYETSKMVVPDRSVILGKLCRSENHRLRQYVGRLHAMWLVDDYLRGNLNGAGFHADAISSLGADLDASGCNNVG